jgi:hypothetical protein
MTLLIPPDRPPDTDAQCDWLHAGLIHLSVGVVGHRDPAGDSIARIEAEVLAFLEDLSARYPQCPLRMLSPLAEGADRLAARCFLRLKDRMLAEGRELAPYWELVVPLPRPEKSYCEDFLASVNEFQSLKARASFVFELPLAADDATDSTTQRRPDRDHQYQHVGRYIARHSHILLGLWDGLATDTTGGTSQIVTYKLTGSLDEGARRHDLFSDHDMGPVFHIHTPRMSQQFRNQSRSALASKSHAAAFLLPARGQRLEADFRTAFAGIDRFNGRLLAARYTDASLAIAAGTLFENCADMRAVTATDLGGVRHIVALFAAADTAAGELDRLSQRWNRILYALGASMAVLLPAAIEGLMLPWMIAGYLGAITAAFGIIEITRKRNLEDDRLSYRALAEGLRVQIYWALSDLREKPDPGPADVNSAADLVLSALQGYLGQQIGELRWVLEALRVSTFRPVLTSRWAPELRRRCSQHWIEHQAAYFGTRQEVYELRLARKRMAVRAWVSIGLVAVIGAIGLAKVHAIPELIHQLLVILTVTAPALALLTESYSERLGIEEQAKAFDRMAAVYRTARDLYQSTVTDTVLRKRLLLELGREALIESANWLILRRARPARLPT